jgi:hypothetical protein
VISGYGFWITGSVGLVYGFKNSFRYDFADSAFDFGDSGLADSYLPDKG